jgi:hypothetical protein
MELSKLSSEEDAKKRQEKEDEALARLLSQEVNFSKMGPSNSAKMGPVISPNISPSDLNTFVHSDNFDEGSSFLFRTS